MDDAQKVAVIKASLLNIGRLLPVGMEISFYRVDGDDLPRMCMRFPDGSEVFSAFTSHSPIYLVEAVDISEPSIAYLVRN